MEYKHVASHFETKSRVVHGDDYDYSRAIYTHSKTPVEIRCKKHNHWFNIRPADHIRGQGCKLCGRERTISKRTKKMEVFINDARAIHGDRYDYSKVIYKNALTKIEIGYDGNWFWQTPANHLSGHRSVAERNEMFKEKYRWSQEQFINKALSIHGSKYDYSLVDYKGSHDRIQIICNQHGIFDQLPYCHINENQGCPKCNISSGHQELCNYLDTLGIIYEVNNRKILSGLEIDIYISEKNLGIEYCGLHWHDEIKKGRTYHLDKHKKCEELGIRLITIFEDEWIQKSDIVKSTIRHLCGLSDRGVFARKVNLSEISWSTAKNFLNTHHMLGAGSPVKYRIGAFYQDELIAVMIFGNGKNERGSSDQIEMSRYVCDGRNHPGLASKMFLWALRKYHFDRVVAFVDRRWFSGQFKIISGFVVDAIVPPSLFYTYQQSRFHRRFMTKQKAIKLIGDETLSKRELLERLKYGRIWDCGKLRLIWHRLRS